jgi:hypothetical protein
MRPSQVSRELRRIAAGIDRCSTRVRRDLVSRDVRRVLAAVDGDRIKVVVMSFDDWGDEDARSRVLAEQFGGTAWHVYTDYVILAEEPLGLHDVRPVDVVDLRTDKSGQALPSSAASFSEAFEISDVPETEDWLQGWEKITA